MKVITEAILRDELRDEMPEVYTIPEGKILSPAAREYLQQLKIKIVDNKKKNRPLQMYEANAEAEKAPGASEPAYTAAVQPQASAESKPRYVDEQTGAYYFDKPEHMTQLHGNLLVTKDDKRILFRGKLDSLEATFIMKQIELQEMGETGIVENLEDILGSLREMMKCDVLNLPYCRDRMIGLTHEELRDHSHNPMKYYKVKQMVLPNYSLGKVYAILNFLRTQVRETEVAAATAFNNGKGFDRADIIEELNRMSSAMHILMCRYLAKKQSGEER